MGRLVDGQWRTGEVAPTDDGGAFQREETTFRGTIEAPEAGRYLLYVSYACPWAHRTLVARALLGLQDAIDVSVVDPHMGEDGWAFSQRAGCVPDPIFGAEFLREVYTAAKPDYTGKVTVPVLLDTQTKTIVNNESREVLRLLCTEFSKISDARIDLCPAPKRSEIDAMIDANYGPINNGVYRAGFAKRQPAYDEAIDDLFVALDRCERRLRESRFLCGDTLTEADICLFTTLIRFDVVYHTHFKCNVKRIVDYPALWGFVRDIYQMPGVAQTCNFDHIRRHYYGSHPDVNPHGIVARGPALDYESDHGRG